MTPCLQPIVQDVFREILGVSVYRASDGTPLSALAFLYDFDPVIGKNKLPYS